MISVLERCFPHKSEQWGSKLKEIVPSYGMKLSDRSREAKASQKRTAKVLGLSAKG
jgi:malate dehydrogenase (quinone)